jgi:hypothetical protein
MAADAALLLRALPSRSPRTFFGLSRHKRPLPAKSGDPSIYSTVPKNLLSVCYPALAVEAEEHAVPLISLR